jgi:hypothetical protein
MHELDSTTPDIIFNSVAAEEGSGEGDKAGRVGASLGIVRW